ncbi:MAG: hypothetical protein Q7U35_03375 [Methanobacteriaceae archaeon]|nr:hypothetical protein [Methanobacteriaceae archaeon]
MISKDRISISIDPELKEVVKHKFPNVSEMFEEVIKLLFDINDIEEAKLIHRLEKITAEREILESKEKILAKKIEDMKFSRKIEGDKSEIIKSYNELENEYGKSYFIDDEKALRIAKLENISLDEVKKKIINKNFD